MALRMGLALLAAVLAAACSEAEVDVPQPVNLAGDEIGYFCNMIVVNHDGPKGQIFLRGRDQPHWFTSVLDTLVFTRLPDEPGKPVAIYVTDIGRAQWDQPEPDTWIDATQAYYVVGSDRVGGMGAPEIVPFGQRDAAQAFTAKHGGEVIAYDAIADELLFELARSSESQAPGQMLSR